MPRFPFETFFSVSITYPHFLLHSRSASANEVSSRRYGRQNSNSLLEQEFATEENLSSSLGSKYSHIISMVLLACAFIFFAVLGVLYISVGSEEVPNVIKGM